MSGRDVTADGPVDVARALTADGAVLRGRAGLRHVARLYDGRDLGQVADAAGRPAHRGTRLPDRVISHAVRTHPVVITSGTEQVSSAYLGAGRLPPGCDDPLPPPAPDAVSIGFDGQLGQVREFSAVRARAAGLDSARVSD